MGFKVDKKFKVPDVRRAAVRDTGSGKYVIDWLNRITRAFGLENRDVHQRLHGQQYQYRRYLLEELKCCSWRTILVI